MTCNIRKSQYTVAIIDYAIILVFCNFKEKMASIIDVTLDGSSHFYKLFYLLSYSISLLVIVYFLLKNRKWTTKYLLGVSGIFIAFIYGTKLLPLLDSYFEASLFSNPYAQMTVGGVILMTIALPVLVGYLNLDRAIYKYFAFALLLGVAIQKPGCLLAGCCLGNYHDNLVTVNYSNGLFYSALPLYESLAYLLVFLSLLTVTNLFRVKNQHIFWVAIFCFSIIQFLFEFGRNEMQTVGFSNIVLGLKILQLIYLGLATIALCQLFLNRITNQAVIRTERNQYSEIILMVSLIVSYSIIYRFLYKIETIVIYFALIPILALVAYRTWQNLRRRYLIALTILPLLLMSQTVSEVTNTERDFNSVKEEFNYFKVGAGFKKGKAYNRIVHDPNPDDCMGPSYSNSFEHQFWLVGGNFTYVQARLSSKNKPYYINWGTNLTFGQHWEKIVSSFPQNIRKENTFDINPFWSVESNWIGLGLGLHAFSFSHLLIKDYKELSTEPETGTKWGGVTPQVSFRVGPKKYFFAEYNLGSKFMIPFPENPQYFIFGSQFGSKNGFELSWGINTTYDFEMFLSSQIPIEKHFIIEPLYRFGDYNSFMINAYYRFNKKPYKDEVKSN